MYHDDVTSRIVVFPKLKSHFSDLMTVLALSFHVVNKWALGYSLGTQSLWFICRIFFLLLDTGCFGGHPGKYLKQTQ